MHAWRCSCGTLNEGKLVDEYSSGKRVAVCRGCRFECSRERGTVTERFVLVPVALHAPWEGT